MNVVASPLLIGIAFVLFILQISYLFSKRWEVSSMSARELFLPPAVANLPQVFRLGRFKPLKDRSFDSDETLRMLLLLKEMKKPQRGSWYDSSVDGEHIDALERFFWGIHNGIAVELGAMDGTPRTLSMTYDLEASFGWNRILIEANPMYHFNLTQLNPNAMTVHAAICNPQHSSRRLHYRSVPFVGGIIEFMSPQFLQSFHRDLYEASQEGQDFSLISDWSIFDQVQEIHCENLNTLFSVANVRHIHYFLLDVEGGEWEVLQSIDWNSFTFDVITVETDPPYRSDENNQRIKTFLQEKGYEDCCGQIGRNRCKRLLYRLLAVQYLLIDLM